MSKEIEEYDEKGNLIYRKYSDDGDEYWYRYDENNNLLHINIFKGCECFHQCSYEYDENNNLIHWKSLDSDGDSAEYFMKYDENNEKIDITQKEFEQIKARKAEHEFLNREEITRFELMELIDYTEPF